MNLEQDNKVLNQYLDSNGGNIYRAIQSIASDARQISAQYNNAISATDSLNCLIYNTEPKVFDGKNVYIQKVLADELQYIQNPQVIESVKLSIEQSVAKQYLLYSYVEDISEHDKIRVRILTNKIWSKI